MIESGDGWRIGWHPHSGKYQGLVGANDWAFELTLAELKDFGRLLYQLVSTMNHMEAELMEQEKISCETESEFMWMEVEGYPGSYSLRLILNRDRRCEGNWVQGVAPRLLDVLESWDIN